MNQKLPSAATIETGEILDIYNSTWAIEQDLKDLKATLDAHVAAIRSIMRRLEESTPAE